MKKLIYSATLMVLAFFAASCQQENLEPVAGGETVSYKVQVPDALATKASGDGFTVYYQVYRDADLKDGDFLYDGSEAFSGGSATLDLKFVRNQNFTVLFWAQKTTGVTAYDIADLREVKLATLTTNDANAEVFVGTDNVENCVSIKKGIVELKRPVAQLNIATLTSGLKLGETSNAHQVDPSKVKVTLHGLYTSYNVATGDVDTSADVEFDEANSIKNEFITGYTHLVQNFIGFIPEDGDNIDVDFTINAGVDGYIEHSVSNVPVKPNYRTNIIGNLVSGTAGYSITIDEAWTTPDNTVEVVTVSNAADLQEAINNIQAGTEGNIKLEGDIDLGDLFGASTLSVTKAGGATLPIEIPEEKAMTLDLNGFTITTPWEDETAKKHYYAFDNKGTLKIVDSKAEGKIVARGIFNYGIMTLESGSIEACDGNGGYGVRNYEGAKFVMNGGTVATIYEDGDIPGEGYDACPIRVDQGAKAEIKGGIINNVSNFTVAIDNYGETIVDGGTFTSVHTTLANSAVMTINGGSFTCNGLEGITAHALWAAEGTTTINGGTFNGKDNYNGFNVDASTGATVYIKGGEFLPVHSGSLYGDGTIIVTGGTFFDQVPEKYLAAGYSCQQNDEGKWIVPQVALAKIGEFSYPTLDAAIEAVAKGVPTTITVQAAVFAEESIVIPAGKSVTLDLNGKTLSNPNGYAIENYSELTITGEGSIAGLGSIRSHAGKVTIEDGTFTASSKWSEGTFQHILKAVNTVVTINGGVFTPTVSEGSNAMINVSENSTVTINSGEFRNVVKGEVISQFAPYMFTYEKNGKLIINDGSFYGGWRFNGETATTDIYGGDFTVSYDGQSFHANSTHVLTIYGGTFSLENGGKLDPSKHLADGYKAVQNAETRKWEVVAKPYVAQIREEKYYSLQEAFNVGGEITLLCDVKLTEMAVLESGKTATLDLNGYNITVPETTGNHIYALENKGTLTIKDSRENGSISSRGIHNNGTLTLESGKLSAIDGNGGYAVNNKSGSTFVMNGGWIAADNEDGDAPVAGNYDATALNVLSDATATINGGKITNAGNFTYAVSSAGTLIIPETSTIEISGRHGVIAVSGGNTTINAGSYSIPENTEYTDNVVYVYGSGKLVINGGTFTGDNDRPNGGACVSDTVGGVTINGGNFGNSSGGDVWGTTGTVITGGKFENLTETKYIAEGYELNDNGEVVKVQ